VLRNSSIRNLNEYDGAEGQLELTALRYPCRHVSMTLKFRTTEIPDRLHFYVIRGNSVEDQEPSREDGPGVTTYCVKLNDFANASLRALWENAAPTQKTAH